jgi:hypothetical protein
MTHTGGENATPGFREQMTWQLRAARVLTDLLERGDLPVLEWTISHNGTQVTSRSYAQPGSARRAPLAVDELIARRMQAGAGGQDLVSRLLSTRDADTGEPMDAQQVRDEALIFLLAGHETTSTALTFASRSAAWRVWCARSA